MPKFEVCDFCGNVVDKGQLLYDVFVCDKCTKDGKGRMVAKFDTDYAEYVIVCGYAGVRNFTGVIVKLEDKELINSCKRFVKDLQYPVEVTIWNMNEELKREMVMPNGETGWITSVLVKRYSKDSGGGRKKEPMILEA